MCDNRDQQTQKPELRLEVVDVNLSSKREVAGHDKEA